MNIFLIGQVTLHWGRMEFGNIGNYYIIEPFVRELHKNFPGAVIKTTLQMSEQFCNAENITVLPMELYYGFNGNEMSDAVKELSIAEHFYENGILMELTPYIKEVMDADMVIDFSGDIWGDNANFLGKDRFIVGLYKDFIAQKLRKPVYMLAGSPGPFNSKESISLAKEVFKGFRLVTNREAISTELLTGVGFDVSRVKDLACPAFLFQPSSQESLKSVLSDKSFFNHSKNKIGVILCGWNFKQGPFDKWPREEEEYTVFAEVIEAISSIIDADIYLLSHANGFPIPPQEFELKHGRDYPIIKQLQKVIEKRGKIHNVKALDGVYDAWTTKAIIKEFDMLISGRIHGAVAALSQSIPTVILDYGHEPKAHKSRGFAAVAGVEEFVCDPLNKEDILVKTSNCWLKREEIRLFLNDRMSVVQDMARQQFKLLKEDFDSYSSNKPIS